MLNPDENWEVVSSKDLAGLLAKIERLEKLLDDWEWALVLWVAEVSCAGNTQDRMRALVRPKEEAELGSENARLLDQLKRTQE